MNQKSLSVWLRVICAVGALCTLFLSLMVMPMLGKAILYDYEELAWLYWPCLIAGLALRRRQPELLGQRAFALLAATAGMLGIGYLYHIPFQGDSLIFDIVLYLLMMAVFFLLPYLLHQPFWQNFREVLVLLVLVLGIATLLFTFLPPNGLLFTDLSGTPTWVTLPC